MGLKPTIRGTERLLSCGPVAPIGQLLTPVGWLHLGEMLRLPACLGSVAVAAQIEADGFVDAGAARLAQLRRQQIQLALQLWLHPHTKHHGGSCSTLRITLALLAAAAP